MSSTEYEETDADLGVTPELTPLTPDEPYLTPPHLYRREPFQSAVAFWCMQTTQRRDITAMPQALFRAEGLWLWGTDETTLVHNLKTGNQTCFMLSNTPLPGLYFQAGMSFEEFEALLEKAPAGWSHERLRELPPLPDHQRIRMLTAEIGNHLVLDVEGPLTHAVMWGKTIQ